MKTRVTLRYFVNDCRIRGTKKGSVNIGNYADSVVFVHLTNVENLIKVGGLLDWVKNKYSSGSFSSTSNVYVKRYITEELLNKYRLKIRDLLKF